MATQDNSNGTSTRRVLILTTSRRETWLYAIHPLHGPASQMSILRLAYFFSSSSISLQFFNGFHHAGSLHSTKTTAVSVGLFNLNQIRHDLINEPKYGFVLLAHVSDSSRVILPLHRVFNFYLQPSSVMPPASKRSAHLSPDAA